MNFKYILYTFAIVALALVVVNNNLLTPAEMSSSPVLENKLTEDERINYRLQQNQKKMDLRRARINSRRNKLREIEHSNDFENSRVDELEIDSFDNERELAQQGIDDEIAEEVENIDDDLENFPDEDREFLQDYIENARKNGVKVEIDKNYNVNVK